MSAAVPGERWGYRSRGVDPLVEVDVLRLGTQKPARVLIRFVDESFEGREEWVPPARLKVLWDGAAAFEAREARWERVDTHPGLRGEPTEYALDAVFRILIDPDLATGDRAPGVMAIHDLAGLASYAQLDEAQLRNAPESFVEDGDVIVPWATTELVAHRVCQLYPDELLREVEKEEREARREAIHGRWYSNTRRTRDYFVSAEDSAAHDREWPFLRPTRELLRTWCGSEAVDRQDELRALRDEVGRLDRLVADAVGVLRAHGLSTPAAQLEREFGVPVEEARRSRG